MIAVQILELVHQIGEYGTFPRFDGLRIRKRSIDHGSWVEVEVSSDLRILETTSKKQQRAFKTSGRDDNALGFDDDLASGSIRTVDTAEAVL